MPVFHTTKLKTTAADKALGTLRTALEALSERREADADFESFERKLHELFVHAERDMLAQELMRLDVDLPYILIGGVNTTGYCAVPGAIPVQRVPSV